MLAGSYEEALLVALYRQRQPTGLFTCNSWTVFSNATVLLGQAEEGKATTENLHADLAVRIGGTWNTALNTKVFTEVWHRVFRDKLYRVSDWTVKVDPDAVFLPWRLREHLLDARPKEKVFLNNCRAGLHGPIEVISLGGMRVFDAGIADCEKTLRGRGEWELYGEDVFLRHCLSMLGLRKDDDFGLLSEVHCYENPSPCISGKVVFHPFKTLETYVTCLNQALGSKEDKRPGATAAIHAASF